jgi:CheY-like chemotaxis protein
MEINLPDINGMEALKILRECPETAHIPVIAVSSNAYEKQIEEALKAGCNRYLTKPYKINDLMNAIDVGLNDTK